jgi:hypothetical protein
MCPIICTSTLNWLSGKRGGGYERHGDGIRITGAKSQNAWGLELEFVSNFGLHVAACAFTKASPPKAGGISQRHLHPFYDIAFCSDGDGNPLELEGEDISPKNTE